MLMDLSSIALQGLQQAEAQAETAAANLVSAGSASSAANLDTVDLSTQILALNSAQTLAELSAATLNTADQIQQTVIDLQA